MLFYRRDLEKPIASPTHVSGNTMHLVLLNIIISFSTIEPRYFNHLIISFSINATERGPNGSNTNNIVNLFKQAEMSQLMLDCNDVDTAASAAKQNSSSLEAAWHIIKDDILAHSS